MTVPAIPMYTYRLVYPLQRACWPHGFYVARAWLDLLRPTFQVIYPSDYPGPDPKRMTRCRAARWQPLRWRCEWAERAQP